MDPHQALLALQQRLQQVVFDHRPPTPWQAQYYREVLTECLERVRAMASHKENAC